MKKHSEVLIIGAGPAGYTAAIYAARASLKPRLIAGLQPGGQLMTTLDVENYPGFAEPIAGPSLMEQMARQAVAMGTIVEHDIITSADFSRRPFLLNSDNGVVYTCNALIIATGAQAKWLGLKQEQAYKGFGVSACATCDGPLFRNKVVAVVGGGNTAVEEALFLANFAEKVILIHRRNYLRAEKILQQKLFNNPKINIRWNSEILDISGEENPRRLENVEIRNIATKKKEILKVQGLFIAIGHSPSTAIFNGQLQMKDGDYIFTAPDSTQTNIPGIFAAGDVTDNIFRQAVTAAGMGCMAALEAERFLSATKSISRENMDVSSE